MSHIRQEALLNRLHAGFSFVELLVAVVIGASVLGLAVIAFGSLSRIYPEQPGSLMEVTLPSGVPNNFYGIANATLSVPPAPAAGELARAEALREQLERDVAQAVAVFCLARTNTTTFRPTSITVNASFDGRTLTTPNAFLSVLGSSASSFLPYTGAATNHTRTSLFLLGPGNTTTTLPVLAVYEMDIVGAVQPPGFYASVRRYSGGTLSGFYHVFYPQTAAEFRPPVAYFARPSQPSGSGWEWAFQAAPNRPFYFIWWPDPMMASLPTNLPAAFNGAARSVYSHLGPATSFFMVLPAFPSL